MSIKKCCLRILFLVAVCQAAFLEYEYPHSVIEDARLTTLELLSKYNYPNEAHHVTTEDNYILELHRIPRRSAKPILLVHGIQDSSATWISMGPHSGLGYYLYDEGYDIWMGNVRGNRYSRNHTRLNPNKKKFWNYSFHEIGLYDLPAMIDYVLKQTKHLKLTYFGHSQGTTSFFVMASMRPVYNERVHLMHALAPVAYMNHMKAPLLNILEPGIEFIENENFEVFKHSDNFYKKCLSLSIIRAACEKAIYAIIGGNAKNFNETMLPVVLGHIPSGGSFKQISHYMQLRSSGRFRPFDDGDDDDEDYPIQRITVPVALHYTKDDYLDSVNDVERLADQLPNVVDKIKYPNRNWNHMDLIWGKAVREHVQPHLLKLTQKWDGSLSNE